MSQGPPNEFLFTQGNLGRAKWYFSHIVYILHKFLQMNELAEVLALAGTVCTTSSSGTKPYFCLDFSIWFSIEQQLKDEVSDRTYIVCWSFLLGFFPW